MCDELITKLGDLNKNEKDNEDEDSPLPNTAADVGKVCQLLRQ
jgi:hypothetical protein